MSAYTAADFEFESVPVHAITGGAGLPLLLIHGSGPGASTVGNWRLILEPLATRYHVHAMDLIGFGQSGQRREPPYFDVSFWLRQCKAMIARMPGEQIGILGHSLSGALALKLAASEARVAAVMTTGSMGAEFIVNDGTRRCWTFPRDRAALVATAETLIHDRRHITGAYIDNRVKTLFGDTGYERYFTAMFSGDLQRFVTEAVVTADELASIRCKLTMMHGREDTAFPAEISMALAARLPQADLTLLARCSHSIALEFPEKLLSAANLLFDT